MIAEPQVHAHATPVATNLEIVVRHHYATEYRYECYITGLRQLPNGLAHITNNSRDRHSCIFNLIYMHQRNPQHVINTLASARNSNHW